MLKLAGFHFFESTDEFLPISEVVMTHLIKANQRQTILGKRLLNRLGDRVVNLSYTGLN